MTVKRTSQISLEATSFYHCYVRCVRRAYLCGDDHASGQNYDHRKQWIVSRLRFLSYIYAIDICAYAVMSNHYHVVLHVDKVRAESWSKKEVAERWLQLYNGHMLVDRWLAEPKAMDDASLEVVNDIIEEWRDRLSDISWFMRGINEKIARMANEEESVKGRFWESRFKSQALLDEAAILSCMTYVDLNPVRAQMAKDCSDSDFTSIQQRLFDYAKYKTQKSPAEKTVSRRIKQQRQLKVDLEIDKLPEALLMPFDGSSHIDIHFALPFTREDYFDLVDKTGRVIKEGKRGFIAADTPTLIIQLGINPNHWLEHIQSFGKRYGMCAGSVDNIINFAERFDRQWGKGIRMSKTVYMTAN